jgi:uracil-DNA glycosylase family 4
VKLLTSVGWRRDDVFITNVVKCRPPDNRDPEPDEIAACAPFLRRQLEVLDPALVVTLGRFSMGTFMPGARIGQAHGTMRPVDPTTGARDALAYAMYHPAAALRSTDVEATSFRDMAGVPVALLKAREFRDEHAAGTAPASAADGAREFQAPVAGLDAGSATVQARSGGAVMSGATGIGLDSSAPAAPALQAAAEPAPPALAVAGVSDPTDPSDQLTLFQA